MFYEKNNTKRTVVNTSRNGAKAAVKDVNSAELWTLLANETTNSAKREQLIITVRYISKNLEDLYVYNEKPVAQIDLIQEQNINTNTSSVPGNTNASNNRDEVSDRSSNEIVEPCELKLDGSCIGSVIKS